MATGSAGSLYHINFKINSARKGYNLKFHVANSNEAGAKTVAEDIAGRLKKLMPSDAEIFFCTISNDNTKRDSRFIRGALGAGGHVLPGVSPPPSTYDFPSTAILIRLEHEDGGSVTRKINPIPDDVLESEALLDSISDVVGIPATIGAVGSGANWYENFNLLMKSIVKFTHHVKSGHAPGGEYTYFNWANAYVLRAGVKKGGRVFA